MSSAPETEASSAAPASYVDQAKANVEKYYANYGAELTLPPVENTLAGKKVFYVTAGSTSPAGTAGLAAIEALAETVGFDLTPFDGQFTLTKYQEGMRQAIAQGADVLYLFGVDCAGNEAALKEVREAGITIVGSNSVDCDEVDPSAESLFDVSPLYPVGPDMDGSARVAADWADWGAAQADYLIAKLDGNVKVIQFDVPDFAVTAALGQGFRDQMAKCDTCEILETINIGVADFGPGLQQKAEQALIKHPDANAVEINYDDLVTLGLGAAIASSGRVDDLLVVAGEGYENTIDMIREGGKGLNAGYGISYPWDAYAAIDSAMRFLAGQDLAVVGSPTQLYDAEHNLPASGPYVPGTDFATAFEQAWGLS